MNKNLLLLIGMLLFIFCSILISIATAEAILELKSYMNWNLIVYSVIKYVMIFIALTLLILLSMLLIEIAVKEDVKHLKHTPKIELNTHKEIFKCF